ncbi:MAG TPA: hypothetical protein VF057_13015 [Thermoanaerobaculia bacterium]
MKVAASLAACLIVASGIAVAGWQGFASAGGIFLLFALPSLVLLPRSKGNVPVTLALVATSLAACIVAVAVVSAAVGRLSPAVVIAGPLCLAIASRLGLARHIEAAGQPVRADILGALVSALFITGLTLMPLLRVGEHRDGTRVYAAFFNADFFKHMAHVQTIAWRDLPPGDAFAAGERLHYYWFAYIPAASALRLGGGENAQSVLLGAVVIQNALFAALLFAACRQISRRSRAALIATVIGLASLSLDGLASITVPGAYSPPDTMVSENMEARDLTERFGAPYYLSGSTLLRISLYLPQHQLALMMFIAWALLFATGEDVALRRLRLLLMIPLPAMSLAVGALAVAAMLAAEITHSKGRARAEAIAAALIACLILPMAGIVTTPGVALRDPFIASIEERPPLAIRWLLAPPQLITTLGCTILFALGGLWLTRRSGRGWFVAALTTGVSVAAMLASELLTMIRLTVEAQLKTSFVLAAGAVFGSALFFANAPFSRRARLLLFAGLVIGAAGLLSPIHDVVWHSALESSVAVPDEDMDALRWVRANTAPNVVFQQYPEAPFILGGREMWIPVFAGRPVAVSRRSVHSTAADIGSAERLFGVSTPAVARREIATQLEANALYASRAIQPSEYDAIVRAFEAAGFRKVYENGGASVWMVGPEE